MVHFLKHHKYEKGQIVMQQGQTFGDNGIRLVKSGKFSNICAIHTTVSHRYPTNTNKWTKNTRISRKWVHFGEVERGGVLAAEVLFDKKRSLCFVVAEEEGEVLEMTRQKTNELLGVIFVSLFFSFSFFFFCKSLFVNV